MPEMHLRQAEFTYSACGPFIKKKKRLQKFKETGDSRYIYQNELNKACFQYEMAYGDFKVLARRTAADKILTRYCRATRWISRFIHSRWAVFNEAQPRVVGNRVTQDTF